MNAYINVYESRLGRMIMASDGTALTGLWFEGQKYFMYGMKDYTLLNEKTPVFTETEMWLDLYFSGKVPGFTPPLAYGRTEFDKTVCDIMLTIPYGSVMTYGEIAVKAAEKLKKAHMSAQAVGGAVGHNPISVIIPCHRVVGAGGSLTGYAGGIQRKASLLTGEGVDFEKMHLYIP